MLPKLDGFHVLKELRANHITTPILMLTAKADLDSRVHGLDSGADYYLTKPFETPELLASYLETIADRNGRIVSDVTDGHLDLPPGEQTHSSYDSASIAAISMDSSGTIREWNTNRTDLYTDTDIADLSTAILNRSSEFGIYHGQYYLLRTTPDGYLCILMDHSMEQNRNVQTLRISIIAGILAWFFFLGMAFWLTNRMIRPVQTAFEKQRQFVSDAGHELKTPIAVISANTDVLKDEIGDNKWLSYISTEAMRMDTLVRELMTLASMEDTGNHQPHTDFDLSSAVMGQVLPFEGMAYDQGIRLETDVPDDIHMSGNQEQIEKLVSILMNNAFKYCDTHGQISVRLTKKHRQLLFTVYNTGVGVKPEELERIFERFYRVDQARVRQSNSYGLGLAIARAIAEDHHGTLSATGEYGSWIQFQAVFEQ